VKITTISERVYNDGSSTHWLNNSSPFSSVFSLYFYAFRLSLVLMLSFGFLILEFSRVVVIESILVLM